MKYVSGWYALNIDNSMKTCGDWHSSALDWGKVVLKDSESSIYKDWGIETNKEIPEHNGKYNVANDIRAILDFLENDKISGLRGFYSDYFCTDEYNEEFFEKVYLLRKKDFWEKIDGVMSKEFLWEWDNFLRKKGETCGRLENPTQKGHGKLLEIYKQRVNDLGLR